MFDAIEGVGKSTLVIKGTEILGTVTVCGMSRDGASVNFTTEMYDKYIAPLLAHPLESVYPIEKLTFFRFSQYTGMFLFSNIDDESDAIAVDDFMVDVYIVDEFNFKYGLVPKGYFSTILGFGKGFDNV